MNVKYLIIAIALISPVSHAGWLSDRLTPPKEVRNRLKPPKEVRKAAEDIGNRLKPPQEVRKLGEDLGKLVVDAPKALINGVGDAVSKAPSLVNGLVRDVPKAAQSMYDVVFKDNYQGFYKTVDDGMTTFKNFINDVVTLGQYSRDKQTQRAKKALKKSKDELAESKKLLEQIDDEFAVEIVNLYGNLKFQVSEYIVGELMLNQFKKEYQSITEKLINGSINSEAQETYFLELKKLFQNSKDENLKNQLLQTEKEIAECIQSKCEKLDQLAELKVNLTLLEELRQIVINTNDHTEFMKKVVSGNLINDYIFEYEQSLEVYLFNISTSLIKLKRTCGSFSENKVAISTDWARNICGEVQKLTKSTGENLDIGELADLPSVLNLKNEEQNNENKN